MGTSFSGNHHQRGHSFPDESSYNVIAILYSVINCCKPLSGCYNNCDRSVSVILLNWTFPDFLMPLHLARQLRQVDVARILIECGADVSAKSKDAAA
jgi:hypothetical protein